MAEKKLLEELRHCLEGNGCSKCSNYQSESRLTCPALLQRAYEVVKWYEEMEEKKLNNEISRFFTSETIEKSIDCLQKYLNSKPPRKLESEEKAMLHNVTVKHEENKVLEKYWEMIAKKECEVAAFNMKTGKSTPMKNQIEDIKREESDHEPTPQEIAQFLSDSGADFVSVVQNYRFVSELPF